MKTKLTFTEELASDIEHEAGAHQIDFAATPPNVGDHLRIRLAPSGRVVGQIKPTRIRRIIRSRLRLGWSHYFVFAARRRPADATAVG